jgi:subtilisin-like proprotein convertase family protein
LIIPDFVMDFTSMYYWKLEFVNECGIAVSDTIYHFTTLPGKCSEYVSLDVPVALNDNQVCTSDLNVEDDLKILDLNVKMQGNHIAFKELRASLISPDGTKSVLFNHKGTSYQGIFDLTFDEEAKLKLKTKPTGIFKPDSSLTVFTNKQAKGKWTLEIIDNKDQQSGSLKYFSLNMCGEVFVNKPFLIVNKVLKIPTNAYWPISNEYLKVADQDNTDSELIYTVVKTPAYSELYHSSIKLGIGDKFSQDDINNGIIKLRYPGKTNDLSDRFYFTVSDGTGGWIGITSFNFITDETVNNKDEIINYQISVYPNPANNYLNVQIENEGSFMADIIDMKGQKKATKKVAGFVPELFDISGLNNGIYILRVRNEKYNYTSKFVKQK